MCTPFSGESRARNGTLLDVSEERHKEGGWGTEAEDAREGRLSSLRNGTTNLSDVCPDALLTKGEKGGDVTGYR